MEDELAELRAGALELSTGALDAGSKGDEEAGFTDGLRLTSPPPQAARVAAITFKVRIFFKFMRPLSSRFQGIKEAMNAR